MEKITLMLNFTAEHCIKWKLLYQTFYLFNLPVNITHLNAIALNI